MIGVHIDPLLKGATTYAAKLPGCGAEGQPGVGGVSGAGGAVVTADAVGISKSAVSREAGERVLRDLAERRFDDRDILIVDVDGIRFGRYHVVAAVGVDVEGRKHVLGLREGASENATVAAFKLEAAEGMQKLEQLALWLERDHPSAAASLREGLRELFTAGGS